MSTTVSASQDLHEAMARSGIAALACLAVCLAASLRSARADIVVAPVLTSDGVRDCSYTCDQEGGYNSVNGGNSALLLLLG